MAFAFKKVYINLLKNLAVYRKLHTIMAKSWRVTAKRNINSKIPQGFVVNNVITQQDSAPNWPALRKQLESMGIKLGDGIWNLTNWEWK